MERQVTARCGKTEWNGDSAEPDWGVQGKDGLDGRPTGRAKEAPRWRCGGRGWCFLAKLEHLRQAAGRACPLAVAARLPAIARPGWTPVPSFSQLPAEVLGHQESSCRPLRFRFLRNHTTHPPPQVDLRPLFSAASSPSRTCQPVTLPFHSGLPSRPWKVWL